MMNLDQKLSELPLIKTDKTLQKSLYGRDDLTTMWVADMDFQADPSIQRALTERIQNAGFGYEILSSSFKEAQKAYYQKQYHIDLNQEEVLYSPSIPTSISVIIDQLTKEGDGVIIQTPVFFEFKQILKKQKRNAVSNPLLYQEGQYLINFEDLEEKASDPNNKVLIFTNPHNPVGRVWTEGEIKKVIDICKRNNVLIISDEIHKDIILFDHHFTSLLKYKEDYDKIVIVTSEGKTFNFGGISDSMAIIPNEEIRFTIQKQFDILHFGRPNALSQVAVEAAYRNSKNWLASLKSAIEENYLLVKETLVSNQSKIKVTPLEGTYLLWLDFSKLFDHPNTMFTTVTNQTQLALNAGKWFGREGALFMRMNIATSREKVQDAISRLIEMEKSLS
ncbi:MalY/PatB family protein [Flammeovirga agarivorans]|uniref:cysteine-S-conjugate beta-lyase n=1 Tax=Flammeovirga agarivorans TaxID=2726742 RepID=A0A7X8SGR1_9BACT|nr:PatB family C-S lyase [Flammeovirga agarivorans]NLR89828.1 putative C-S lyase [Flammeovirga agarivorans]